MRAKILQYLVLPIRFTTEARRARRGMIHLLTCAALLGVMGCATLSGPEVIAQVEYACQDAAETVAPEILAEWPEKRADLENALREADAFAVSTNITVNDLRGFLTKYGIDTANSREARLVVAGAKIIIRRAGRNLELKTPDVLRAAARGIAAGLRGAGIGTPSAGKDFEQEATEETEAGGIYASGAVAERRWHRPSRYRAHSYWNYPKKNRAERMSAHAGAARQAGDPVAAGCSSLRARTSGTRGNSSFQAV